MLAIFTELFPALSGGIMGLIPSVFKYISQSRQQARDNAHEIAIMELSYKHARSHKNLRLAEQEIIAKSDTATATLAHDVALGREDGIKGFLRATVRPICTYAIVLPLSYTMWQGVFLSRSVTELSVFIPPDLIQFTITSVVTFWFSAQAMRRDKS